MTRHEEKLRRHAFTLASQHDVRIIERPHLLGIIGNFADPKARKIVVQPVVCKLTYAAALHEIGHCVHPQGLVRTEANARDARLMLIEEDAAWTWTREHALVWTPEMEVVRRTSRVTYEEVEQRQRQEELRQQRHVVKTRRTLNDFLDQLLKKDE